MDRKTFFKRSLLFSAALVAQRSIATEVDKASTYDKLLDQVGFNHLPNKEEKTMKSVLHKADTRGQADHGWLNTHHTFSFANYYNPERMNFGVLRVLNDDVVAAGKGFGTHPHDNMEIVSIPLSGDLEHKDSMGNTAVIKEGDIQVLSAGTGIFHSEYNHNKDQEVKFLQIWMFPKAKNVEPRYDQISLSEVKKTNEFYQILSPSKDDQGVWVHQDAWFYMADLETGKTAELQLKDSANNGFYFFVINGEVMVGDQKLSSRDGYGLWDIDKVKIAAKQNSKVLAMEVPMEIK